MSDNDEMLEALLAPLRGPDGRVQLDGTRVATTAQIRSIALTANADGFERQLQPDVIRRLDPDGYHVVCVRPNWMENAGPTKETEDGEKYSEFDMTLGTTIPCEVMLKLEGRKAPTTREIDIRLYDLLRLPAEGRKMMNREQRRKAERMPRDGQRRTTW